ncbi:putative disease resistance protein RGA3 isoform X2 [Rhododendron vialii]|uniref:putative disease resistance protein RGA3 isoform X2 n=1 Tax=Rhododendron vialii TaxID=182163 RepID=UPI00265FA7B2|nr:putative disease resistance protein RGA3 isoform X2 [Rhododendron vialii]
MAEALIAAVQAVLTTVIPLVTEPINRVVFDFQEHLRFFRSRLTTIQALLRDAEKSPRKIESESMKLWLKNLKLATCEAENVLDRIAYESLRNELEGRKRDKVIRFFSHSNPLLFRLKIANEVKNVNSLLDRICKGANDIGLSPVNLVEPTRLTHPFIDDSTVVGRNGDVSRVRDMLLGSGVEDDHLAVVAIVGMAGLGKTTLAQLLYKDKEVVSYFEQKMWICVFDDFGAQRLLNEMMQSLTGHKSDAPNIEGIVRRLHEELNGKKYLLVLDNVWNTSADTWVCLRNCLQEIGGCKGSKIMVTARSMEVVSTMRTSPSLTHRLSELSYEESWNMFRKRAFANGGPIENRTLMDIGRKMVAQCKGVPLAINSLGGLLYSKQLQSEWELIEKTEMWESLAKEDGILPVLRLSYDHLPSPYLKQCFAFCSFFPKNFEIRKDELIWLWMGLGYLNCSSGGNWEMEDVGNEYFNILLRNSLLQDVKLDENNDIETCKMHDLVHELARVVSEGSCLTLKASEVKDHSEVQHLTLHLGEGEGFENLKDGKRLRTLSLTGHLPKDFRDVKYIRALTLKMRDVKELPSSMRKLKHLRYLDLSSTSIEKVPDYVTSFYNLQTLRLPPLFLKELEVLEFHKLVSLRHLCISDREDHWKSMPKMIGHLTSLQTLPLFMVGEDKDDNIEELGSLSKLRGRFDIYGLQHVKDKEEAEKCKMREKSGITKLGLHWDGDFSKSGVNHEDVLQGLKPDRNVKHLLLENFRGRRLASWMSGDGQLLYNLVRIELRSCFNCEQVPRLGHLPHLEVVELDGWSNLKRIGPDFYGLNEIIVCGGSSSSGAAPPAVVFPALRTVSLKNMPQLEEWSNISSLTVVAPSTLEFFPCLELLRIWNCPQLITIAGDLLSIQTLTISWESLDSSGKWRDFYKPRLAIGVLDSTNISLLMAQLLEKICKSLRILEISGFKELCYLPNQLLDLSSLERLEISNCSNLDSIIENKEAAFDGLRSLQWLWIWKCIKLRCLPKGLLQQTLVTLEIKECPDLEMAHPDELRTLSSLKNLRIERCPRWKIYWEEGLLCLTSLKKLVIGGFSRELEYFPWPSSARSGTATAPNNEFPFISLESLSLLGWKKLKHLPDQLQHLTTLRELKIRSFKGLEALPEWLGNVSAPQTLYLYHCSNKERGAKNYLNLSIYYNVWSSDDFQ